MVESTFAGLRVQRERSTLQRRSLYRVIAIASSFCRNEQNLFSLSAFPGPVAAVAPVSQTGGPAPAVVEKFQSVTIRETESVTLRCKSSGHQNPTVVWTKDDVPIVAGQSKYKIEIKAEESTLIIQNATLDDSGWYQCMVTSTVGTTSIRGRVSVQPKQQQQITPPFIKTAGAPLKRTENM